MALFEKQMLSQWHMSSQSAIILLYIKCCAQLQLTYACICSCYICTNSHEAGDDDSLQPHLEPRSSYGQVLSQLAVEYNPLSRNIPPQQLYCLYYS